MANHVLTAKPIHQRDSNLELYRVIVMILIVAHHYVVNSGLLGVMSSNPALWQSLFLRLFGAWGKTGINCYVLITGYFMCTKKITVKKYAKLLLEVVFYAAVIYLVFAVSGYESLSLTRFLYALWPIKDVGTGFTSCFLLFYLTIPFLNILIEKATQKQHFLMMLLVLFIYSGLASMKFVVKMNYISWFMVLYIVAAYIRRYPSALSANTKFWGWATIVSLLLSIVSVVVLNAPGKDPYMLLSDSNKVLALLNGICSFMYFKNLKMKYCRWVNVLGGATFGVLQIHANSDAMRQWLWVDVLQNVKMYDSPYLMVHAAGSVLGVFAVCVALDCLRARFLEVPLFCLWDKYWDKILVGYYKIEEKVLTLLNIKE